MPIDWNDDYLQPVNWSCYAIGTRHDNGQFTVRRVVWGRLLAREERRPGEQIRAAAVVIRGGRA